MGVSRHADVLQDRVLTLDSRGGSLMYSTTLPVGGGGGGEEIIKHRLIRDGKGEREEMLANISEGKEGGGRKC